MAPAVMARFDQPAFDAHMMAIALRLAERRLGQTSPNPSVGSVIADEATGELIARAATAPGGRPHAETQAITQAGPRAAGKTIYVTLEPCAHHGQTGPCAEAIIAAGLARAVVAIEDPDPRVAGRGLDRLRAAGLQVVRGVAAPEARWLTRGHIVRVTERRPFVTIKMALDATGQIARGHGGAPVWVTGPEARANGVRLRASSEAILVGSATVRDDDPQLTCRLPGLLARSPVRCVLSWSLNIPLDSRLVQTARQVPVIVFTRDAADPARRAALERAGVEVVAVSSVQERLWLPSVMDALVARGVTRLLVEGGPVVWRQFAAASFVDEVALYLAKEGYDAAPSRTGALATAARYLGPLPLTLHDVSDFNTDRLWRFRRSSPNEGR
jgi:diaminohydroxyphosphoribosylaminopyrimidine deaminase / 5-amino-6-(5-phosphoribosylamino)uracil reductase